MKKLTDDERNAALAVCKEINRSKEGLCERDFPRFKHKKTGKIVKLAGVDESYFFPSIQVVAVIKDPNKRHVRTTPVGALNFQRDYEPISLQEASEAAMPPAAPRESRAATAAPVVGSGPEVVSLFKAAWGLMVEQQAGPEGWSMAKRWAFEALREAMQPFRTEAGDELDLNKVGSPSPVATEGAGQAIQGTWMLGDVELAAVLSDANAGLRVALKTMDALLLLCLKQMGSEELQSYYDAYHQAGRIATTLKPLVHMLPQPQKGGQH